MRLDGPNDPDQPAIRPYQPEDLAAVYDICVRTGDAGGDARGRYLSDDLIPDVFAGPYLYLEPGFAFVLDHQRQPAGDVLGTPDTASFARAYRERWIPRLARRYPVPPDRVEFGNMQSRFAPEQVSANTEQAVAASAREAELHLLEGLYSHTNQVLADQYLGATGTFSPPLT